jgi:hypothetical protein
MPPYGKIMSAIADIMTEQSTAEILQNLLLFSKDRKK